MQSNHIRLVDGIAADVNSELRSAVFENKQEVDEVISYLESMIKDTIKEFKKDTYPTLEQ
jgi:hypothetical protein